MEIVFRIIVFIVASLIILYLSRDPLSVRQIISWIFLFFQVLTLSIVISEGV